MNGGYSSFVINVGLDDGNKKVTKMKNNGFSNYMIIDAPKFIFNKNNTEWTKQQANVYRNWVDDNYQKRSKYLQDYLMNSKYKSKLKEVENTPEVFKIIWKSFLENCEFEKVNPLLMLMEGIDAIRCGFKADMEFFQSIRYKLSHRSECVVIDIAFFLADYIINKHSNIRWIMITGPENDIEVNSYLLTGFYDCEDVEVPFAFNIDPLNYVGSLCSDMLTGEDEITENSLYDMYMKIESWAKKDTKFVR